MSDGKTTKTDGVLVPIRTTARGARRPKLVRPKRNIKMTDKRKERFLAELAMTCNASASARAVGVLEGTAFQHRTRNPEFRAAWDRALAEGYVRLEMAMMERALHGTKKVIVSGGAARTVREVDASVAMRLLAMHRDRVERERERGRSPAADAGEPAARLMEKLAEMAERLRDPA